MLNKFISGFIGVLKIQLVTSCKLFIFNSICIQFIPDKHNSNL